MNRQKTMNESRRYLSGLSLWLAVSVLALGGASGMAQSDDTAAIIARIESAQVPDRQGFD